MADTEIDWVAYMQEVEGYLAGEYDYMKLQVHIFFCGLSCTKI